MPLPAGLLHVHLHESAGQLLRLPWRGRFAGFKPDDHIARPDRLPGLHPDVAYDAVALVQEAENGDTVGHRRHVCGVYAGRTTCPGRLGPLGLLLRLLSAPAARQKQRERAQDGAEPHDQSGVQGW